jgi:uncharacterized membrane protein
MFPRNKTLAASDPSSPDTTDLWRHYLSRWTVLNHVRTLGATVAACLLTLAIVLAV